MGRAFTFIITVVSGAGTLLMASSALSSVHTYGTVNTVTGLALAATAFWLAIFVSGVRELRHPWADGE